MTVDATPLSAAASSNVDFLANPYQHTEWVRREACITDATGATVFRQEDVEAPATWSQSAVNIVASKYFHGQLGTPEREYSVKQLVRRVVETIVNWGIADGYFGRKAGVSFGQQLAALVLEQKASFNSPVWFNVGIKNERRGSGWYYNSAHDVIEPVTSQNKPQCSACFINSVEDSLSSILDLVKTEGMLFKWGSGAGSNLSNLREENAPLSGGGRASGPLSFMKGLDAFAGVIKSGSKARRAAKMVILNIDHPDIEQFIHCKVEEEKKAHALIAAGYDGSFEGEAYATVAFQNANNSVRVTDEFMGAVTDFGADNLWTLRSVVDDQPKKKVSARNLLRQIAEATHQCGDPGLQFDTTINRWHTCEKAGRINASNPCAEFMFLDDSACNLASLNLLKFVDADGTFQTGQFCDAVALLITAQEILIDNASYPTEKIARNSLDFRPLGLGFANLGALLMSKGLAYDSEAGRELAGSIASLMTAQAYAASARIAQQKGPFAGYDEACMLKVISYHRHASQQLQDSPICREAFRRWKLAYDIGSKYGFRNAQVTLIAPTGTIGFMMDCDTTGIEPELALVKYKKLVGGGTMKIVNQSVPAALRKLGYAEPTVADIIAHVEETGTIEAVPGVQARAFSRSDDHLAVFDCSFRPANGKRSIRYMGHIKMMAAVQPFLSGAVSKTINMPQDSTLDDIMDAYIWSWKLGLKAVAIYRDGSKGIQPLSTKKADAKAQDTPGNLSVNDLGNTPWAQRDMDAIAAQHDKFMARTSPLTRQSRRPLSDERNAITRKFSIGGHEGYLTVGLYQDGTPGELFVTMAKEGSTISGLMDTFAIAISHCLQWGVPLQFLIDKFKNVRFEPSGFTGDKDIPYAKSIVDFIFQWLEKKFPALEETPPPPVWDDVELTGRIDAKLPANPAASDAPLCPDCGSIMVPSGKCHACRSCGNTSGCS